MKHSFMVAFTLISVVIILSGAGWIIYTTPLAFALNSVDIDNLVWIIGLGVSTLIFCKVIEKPFDNLWKNSNINLEKE